MTCTSRALVAPLITSPSGYEKDVPVAVSAGVLGGDGGGGESMRTSTSATWPAEAHTAPFWKVVVAGTHGAPA